MKYLLLCITILLLSSCSNIPTERIKLDASALKQEDKSFVVNKGKIQLPDGSTIDIQKDTPEQIGNWYIVHEDYIKEHNTNQDDLIDSYGEQVQLNKLNNILKIICSSLGAGVLVLLVLRRKHV